MSSYEMRRSPAKRRTHKRGHPQEGDLSFRRRPPLMTIAAGDRSWTNEMRRSPAKRRTHKRGHPQEGALSFRGAHLSSQLPLTGQHGKWDSPRTM